MSSPLPIPSKAAIRALRGLALGTSCAIGVILEDRRRRICTLRTAIANKEKLRSSRKYHGNFNSAPTQLDDPVILRPDELQWYQRPENLEDGRGCQVGECSSRSNPTSLVGQDVHGEAKQAEPSESAEPPGSQNLSTSSPSQSVLPLESLSPPPAETYLSTQQKAPKWASSFQPAAKAPSINTHSSWTSTSPSRSKLRPKTSEAISAEISQILDGDDEERLDRAVSMFCDVSRTNSPRLLTNAWLEVSARLSNECQASGKWEDASRVLAATIDLGPLDEQQYYAHDPLPLIAWHLQPPSPDAPCSLEAIAMASKLLLARFKEKPCSHAAEVEHLGRRLLTQALLVKQFVLVLKVYWLVLGMIQDAVAFVGWAIQELFSYADHQNVIKCFLLNYSKMNPGAECFHKTLECVVGSVQALNGRKANLVFRAFARMNCPGNGTFRSLWFMKLLQAYWRRHRDFAKSKALFDEVISLGLLDKISRPQGVYRVMVEISVRADEEVMAREYYAEIIQKYPSMISDIPLAGYMALLQAKAGNWNAVHEEFVEMRFQKNYWQQEYDNAFVMILKVFADTHPVGDVRELVTKYIDDLGVQMHPFIVTLVANKYGQCHDTEGFVAWLEYCREAGFALDASFCNSVLHNCQSAWKLSFTALETLYLKMLALNPQFPNDVTHRIMRQAARLGKPFREATGHRVRALSRLAYLGRTTNNRDIYEAMNQEMRRGRPTLAVAIYKRAMRFGMFYCRHCLRLAVYAALRQTSGSSKSALLLISDAHNQGHDVSSAASSFIKVQIDRLQAQPESLLNHMRNLVNRFEALHIGIDPSVLTHMAVVCVKINQQEKAIALCRLAMDRHGSSSLCFSKQSFRALLMAFSQMLDLEGMRQLIGDLVESKFCADRTVLSHLKGTNRLLRKGVQSDAKVLMQDVIRRGIEAVKQVREERRRDGDRIPEATLAIMNDALNDYNNNNNNNNNNNDDDDGGTWPYSHHRDIIAGGGEEGRRHSSVSGIAERHAPISPPLTEIVA